MASDRVPEDDKHRAAATSVILLLCLVSGIALLRAIRLALGEGRGPVVDRFDEPIAYRPIGRVENAFDAPAPVDDLQAAESRIVLDPTLTRGLRGLEPGQQLLVLFHFHRSSGYDLCQHPRGDRTRPQRGVFALRSPQRPNPIGASVVELVAIDENVLTVRGLDAINGSPVLDLKPARS